MNFKIINPIILFISTLILLMIACIFHLMYGNCQTSKLHYYVQLYYVPSKLPEWWWVSNYYHGEKYEHLHLNVYKGYTGKWRSWYEVSGRHSEKFYVAGELNGLSTQWDQNGIKLYEVEYKNGVRNGKEVWYFKNGNFEVESNYLNGELNGVWTNWYENGNKKTIREYKDGKIISEEFWELDGTKTLNPQ